MSVHNTLTARFACPRCGETGAIEVETYLGFGNLIAYEIGSRVRWVEGNVAPKNGGRPTGGNMDGEGYAECPLCAKDFWVKIVVRSDVIERIEPDTERMPYISDEQARYE